MRRKLFVKDCNEIVDCPGRREFLVKAALMAGGLVLTVSGSAASLKAFAPVEDITVPIDEKSPLAKVGGSVVVNSKAGKIIIVRTGEAVFSAYSAKCTHKGTTVEYDAAKNQFVCPRHGSIFDGINGKVIEGPADEPLPSFPATGTAASVKVSAGP